MNILPEKYNLIGKLIYEYTTLLARTIASNQIISNEQLKTEVFEEVLFQSNKGTLATAVKNLIMPRNLIDFDSLEVFLTSYASLYEETVSNHLYLLASTEEMEIIENLKIPKNKVFKKDEANNVLVKLRDEYEEMLDNELKKYNSELLMFLLFSLADRLAYLSNLSILKISEGEINNPKNIGRNPMMILTSLICQADVKDMPRISAYIGGEKNVVDILFNNAYQIYTNDNIQLEQSLKSEEFDLRRIYQLAYMVSKMNLFLESNFLLYEHGEYLKIEEGVFQQSGKFDELLSRTQLEISKFSYDSKLTKRIFSEYSKREGFCPKDLFKLATISNEALRAQVHLFTYEKEKIREIILNLTDVKEYGVDRFLDVLTLKKDIKCITDSKNKISIYPFVELNNGHIMFSPLLLLQASQILESRMLQQSFTKKADLQKFISKHYDEAGIKDLSQALLEKNIPYIEHLKIDQIKHQEMKNAISQKGITKEFDLIFVKNETLFVVEYKTWKINSYNIIQVLKEQKKILNNIASHERAMKIIDLHKKEFKSHFKLEEYNEIELIMVFQNPTAFKYLNNVERIKVFSPKDFIEFV
ncbi:hypothetical protein PTQ21_12900 [Paenibacillus marchantiae]|uniref:hypothetical protein n=1 Tax=Paenibacillus marchantiae TaxID=3026433 RepID=UPI00237AD88C|nr:hypothetical protein [Paenibacillus marchantiae]WDQ35072.1 hypothetical protein PTQ21_12900 [Paenibacillus marchantiae]